VDIKNRVEPSVEILDGPSKDELLTGGPRFTGVLHSSSIFARVVTQASHEPYPPDRLDIKNNIRPLEEIHGIASIPELLTVEPRFTGSPQGSSIVARVVTHRSSAPYPPDRVELKKNVRPSAVLPPPSEVELLTADPIFIGESHSS